MPRRTDQRNEEDATLSSIDLNGLQPQCEGPKLPPFPNRKATLNVIRRLSDLEQDGQAHVFEVTIARKDYALKIVSPACVMCGETDEFLHFVNVAVQILQ